MIPRRAALAILAIMLASHSGHAASALSAGSDVFAGFQSNSKDPIQVNATTLETHEENKQRISVFSGNVVVTRGLTVMKATTMTLYSGAGGAKDPAGKNAKSRGFTLIEATGPVRITSGNSTITGAKAVVDMKAQIMTLTGNVVLTHGTDVVTGDRLTVDLITGRAKVEQTPGKTIRVLISPNSQPGAPAKGKTPPTH